MTLHDLLHFEANFSGRSATVGIAKLIDTRNAVLPCTLGQRLVTGARRHRLGTEMRCGAAEYDEVEQRI